MGMQSLRSAPVYAKRELMFWQLHPHKFSGAVAWSFGFLDVRQVGDNVFDCENQQRRLLHTRFDLK